MGAENTRSGNHSIQKSLEKQTHTLPEYHSNVRRKYALWIKLAKSEVTIPFPKEVSYVTQQV